MGEGMAFGRIAGLPPRLTWSVLVLWLFNWRLAGHTLPIDAPGHTVAARRTGVEVKGSPL